MIIYGDVSTFPRERFGDSGPQAPKMISTLASLRSHHCDLA
jgi:hypothetical protein